MSERDDDGVEEPAGWAEAEYWLERCGEADVELTPETRDRLRDELMEQIQARSRPPDDALDACTPRRLSHPVATSAGRRTATIGLVAAAIVAVALALAVTGPTHPDPEIASESTQPTVTAAAESAPPLTVVADRAAARPGPTLGEPGATYAHRVTVRQGPVDESGEPASPAYRKETWIAIDGNGRRINEAPGDVQGEEDAAITDGSLRFADALTPADTVGLPTDREALLLRLRTLTGVPPGAVDFGDVLVEVLAEAGIPPAVRGALLRGLDALGFRLIPDADGLGPAYEGPGIDGGTFVVIFDEDTVPSALRTLAADGTTVATVSYSEVELRPDLATR